MTDKQTKIHALGAKKPIITTRAYYQTNPQNYLPINKPPLIVKTLPQPQIRYIMVQHPQFDTLLKEFTALRNMYDELLVKFQQKNTQQSLKQNIQEVIQSTQNIQAKMTQIFQDANNNPQQQQDEENKPNIESQLESEKAKHQKQCLQIIETVNRATQKIEELEIKNKDLKKQIQSQKEWRQALQKENKRLRMMFQSMESQKQEELQKLRRQIKIVKEKYQSQQKEKQVQPTFTKPKIDNSQYLAESQASCEQMSGFSRLSVNAETTRKSRVYE